MMGWLRAQSPGARFHLLMAGASLACIGSGAVAVVTGSVTIAGAAMPLVGIAIVTAMLLPLPAWYHQRGDFARRDAALVVPWALLLSLLLPIPFLMASRLGLPLADGLLHQGDQLLGFHSSALVALTARLGLTAASTFVYIHLQTFMLAAVIVPALCGKREANIFLLANLFALAAAWVLFLLLPAIGPWYSGHFVPSPGQVLCQRQVFALRTPGTFAFSYNAEGLAIVCFPSCHVIWAILSAYAFRGLRWLRLAAAVLAAFIVCSTLTTGWHYLVDVLCGIFLAFGALWLAARVYPRLPAPSGLRE